MAYTPELDRQFSVLVCRFAWAAGKPMTPVLGELVLVAAQSVDREKVCGACRDRSHCVLCFLHTHSALASEGLPNLFKDA